MGGSAGSSTGIKGVVTAGTPQYAVADIIGATDKDKT